MYLTWIPGAALPLMTAALTLAQAQAPAFDVATIKSNRSGPGLVRISTFSGRLSAVNVTLRMLMRNAYGLPDFRMSGGPGWIDADRFDVEAKAGVASTAEETRAMLKRLLEERFKVAVHSETREMPVFALVLARSNTGPGARLRRSGADCLPIVPPAGAPPAPPPPPGAGVSGPCPSMLMQGNVSGRQLTMAKLAETLSPWLNRAVIDRTNLDGAFDLDLQWMPDRPEFGRTGPSDLPPLVTAIQEQLGLKLESQRGLVELLIIDRAERPVDY